MPSTYTANNGIEKIGTGEQSGTWGSTTNTNFDIIDRAINGVGTISLSGTSHTLTTSDGTASDGHFKVLVLGGSPTGTNTVTITPNDQDKLYFVHNTTGQTATFTQGSGSNASVLAGASGIIYADGAGAGAACVNLSDQLAISSGGSSDFSALQVGSVDVVDLTSAQSLSSKTLSSSTFGGTLSDGTVATTQSASDNSTKVATTAYVDNATGTLGTLSTQDSNSVSITGGSVTGVTLSSSNATLTGGSTSGMTLAGTGASITSLNASNLASGTVAGARLPYATSSVRGAVRVTVSGDTLTINTSD